MVAYLAFKNFIKFSEVLSAIEADESELIVRPIVVCLITLEGRVIVDLFRTFHD